MFPICLAKYKEILVGSRLFHITVYATKKTKKQACITVISEYTLNRNILFPDGLFFSLVCKKIKRESEKKETEQWKQCILSHSHVFCNHLLFPLVTSALAKFMWPLTWPLIPMENHLFEGKDDWHNANSTSIAVFYG